MVIAHTPVELAQIKKLLYAVRTSNYVEVRRICEKGIDGIINYNDPTDGNRIHDFWQFLLLYIVGETPLLVAAKRNDEIMIQFLLDLGAHPDVTDFKVWMVRVNNPQQDFKMLIYVSNSDWLSVFVYR